MIFFAWAALLAVQAPTALQARELAETIDAERTVLLKGHYERIRKLDFDYGKIGSVLEAIAFLALSEEVKRDGKKVVHGVQYFDATGRTLGELDLVVIDGRKGTVVAVYEVKLSGNPQRAVGDGRKQLARFRKHLKDVTIARIQTETRQGIRLKASHFADCETFGMIGSRGSVKAGFDREFDIARDEFDLLQDWLLRRKPLP